MTLIAVTRAFAPRWVQSATRVAGRHRFLVEHNRDPRPFRWTKSTQKIIAAVKRGFQTLDSIHCVLLCALRRIGLAHTQFAEATCGTIRLKLLKLGALVASASGASSSPWLRHAHGRTSSH